MKRKILFLFLFFVLISFLYSEYKTEMCNRNQGFKKAVFFENGNILDPDVDEGSWHNPFDTVSSADIIYNEFIFYASCDFDRFNHGSRLYIVKFTNKPKFDFIMAESDVKLELNQEQLNSEYYINLQKIIVYPDKSYFIDFRQTTEESINDAYFHLTYSNLKKFNIKWLNEEPLDEKHYLGSWQDGLLFKSKTPGQYIWLENL